MKKNVKCRYSFFMNVNMLTPVYLVPYSQMFHILGLFLVKQYKNDTGIKYKYVVDFLYIDFNSADNFANLKLL